MPPSSQSLPRKYGGFEVSHRLSPSSNERQGLRPQSLSPPYGFFTPRPHEDQAHFRPGTVVDIDAVVAGNKQQPGLSPGENGYYCGWDTLSSCGHKPSTKAENVLILGFEGGLVIYRIQSKQHVEIGKLEGLKGGVFGAKILPWTSRQDPGSDGRPYIAVIVHGPNFEPSLQKQRYGDFTSIDVDDALHHHQQGRQIDLQAAVDIREVVSSYQTTVEIFSLTTRRHVATVYKSPIVDVTYAPNGEPRFPRPIGDLSLDANGKFLVVASGTSGELFLFSPHAREVRTKLLESMRCIGKLWTQVKRCDVTIRSSSSSMAESSSPPEESDTQRQVPIFSLGERWIATVPPAANSLFTLNGVAQLSHPQARPAGIVNVTSPPPPSVTCGSDQPDGGQFMNRISREVTQGVIQASRWVGQQGVNVWNAYWKQGEAGQVPQQPPSEPQPQQSPFPPAYAFSVPTTRETEQEPRVAIYDIQRFLDAEEANRESKSKLALTPLSVFIPPSGCSFLSFAPNGLSLLTVGRKGDEAIVWSLMKIHREWLNSYNNPDYRFGPYVRQLHKVTRMTTSNVIDVAWAATNSRFAIITEKGTIHLHDIPPSQLTWPPLRRVRAVKEAPRDDKTTDTSAPRTYFSRAIDTANTAGAFIRNVRSRSTSAGAHLGNLAMTPGYTAREGSRLIGQSLKFGIRNLAYSADAIYHSTDNKLHMQCMLDGANKNMVRFMTGARDTNCLAVVQGPLIRMYRVRQTVAHRKGQPAVYRAKLSRKFKQVVLRDFTPTRFAPAFVKMVEDHYATGGEDASIPVQIQPQVQQPANDMEAVDSANEKPTIDKPVTSKKNKKNKSIREVRPPEPSDTVKETDLPPPLPGYWSLRRPQQTGPNTAAKKLNPLAATSSRWHAKMEAETNPPFAPFHTDRRCALYLYAEPAGPSPDVPADNATKDEVAVFERNYANWQASDLNPHLAHVHHVHFGSSDATTTEQAGGEEPWHHGPLSLPASTRLHLLSDSLGGGVDGSSSEEMANEVRVVTGEGGAQQVVVVTTVHRGNGGAGVAEGEAGGEFFEEDCEVLEFAGERV